MRAIEHWQRAQKLLDDVTDTHDGEPYIRDDIDGCASTLAAAQVHATLALAGATALQAYSDGSEDELDEWAKTAGEGG